MSLLTQASLILTPNAYKESKLYSIVPSNGNGDMTVVRGTAATATRDNSSGFIEDSPYNLVRYSEQFSDSSWEKANTAISPNVINAPNGNLTADLVARTSTTLGCNVYQDFASGTSDTYTATIYAKLGTISTNFGLRVQGGYPNRGDALFNLSTGVLIGTSNGGTNTLTSGSITNVGNGWYKLTVTTKFATTLTNVRHLYGPSSLTFINSWEGADGALSNAYVWGAQLVTGTLPRDYFTTTNRLNVPRLDYDVAGGCPSILLEPQRTNSISNSIMVGASTSPSTIPTGWTQNANGLTQTVVGIGTENGLSYIDIRFNGVAGSGSNSGIRTTGSQTITAAKDQVWTNSAYFKIIAQPQPPTSYQLVTYERNVSGVGLQSHNLIFSPNTTLQRFSLTSTLTNASTAFTQTDIIGATVNGQTYDFTIRIAAPQLELGAYPTSFIPTTTTPLTRNLDDIFRTGISSLLNPSEGTFYVEIAALANDLTNRIISLSDFSDYNQVTIQFSSISNQIRMDTYGKRSTTTTTNFRRIVTVSDITTFHKVAIVWGSNGIFGFVDGVKYTLSYAAGDPAGNGIPTDLTRLDFKQYYGANYFYGNNKALGVWKTALTDTEAIALTTL